MIDGGSQSHRRSNKGNESCGLVSSRLALHAMVIAVLFSWRFPIICPDNTVAESTPLQFGVSLVLTQNLPYCLRNRYWPHKAQAVSQLSLSLTGFQPMAVNVAWFYSGKLCSNIAHRTQTLVIPLSPASLFAARLLATTKISSSTTHSISIQLRFALPQIKLCCLRCLIH